MTQNLRICNPKNKTSTLKAQNIDNHQIPRFNQFEQFRHYCNTWTLENAVDLCITTGLLKKKCKVLSVIYQ